VTGKSWHIDIFIGYEVSAFCPIQPNMLILHPSLKHRASTLWTYYAIKPGVFRKNTLDAAYCYSVKNQQERKRRAPMLAILIDAQNSMHSRAQCAVDRQGMDG
jgi:hypothetical protein